MRWRRRENWLKVASVAIVLFSLLVVIVVQLLPDFLSGGLAPKDLDVQWTDEDYQSVRDKTGITADAPPEGKDRSQYIDQYSGQKDVNWTLTDSEITAWLNAEPQPGYWPFSDVQFKSHEDSVFELSLSIDPAKLMTFPSVNKYLPQEIKGFLSHLPLQLPAYAKARIRFVGPKQVEVEMLDFWSAGLSVADFAVSDQANQVIAAVLNDAFAQPEAVSVESLTTEEGSLNLTGSWYEQIKRVPADK